MMLELAKSTRKKERNSCNDLFGGLTDLMLTKPTLILLVGLRYPSYTIVNYRSIRLCRCNIIEA